MKRRKFITAAGLATAGAISVPYILPSGRLFARSGSMLAEHVVLVMFAGGVRQQESVLQRYLDDSQGVNIPGNIMYNLLDGNPPDSKIVYGTDGDLAGDTPIPNILGQTLQQQGTVFKEVNAKVAGHYSGLNGLVCGSYGYTQGLRQKPIYPTVFEYARRHMGLKATDTWFVGNGIGNSIPLLNYSEHEDYGSDYGANFLAPNITFGSDGQKHLRNAKVYHPEEELDPIYQMKYFLDNVWLANGKPIPNINNTEEEKQDIKEFIKQMFIKQDSGSIAFPPVNDNGDLSNIGWTCEVMKWFKPKITAVNLSSVDGCHSNFTGYLRSLHRADHGVAHLWSYIQNNIPEMANNTIMIVTPEHGRNLNANPIIDENDWYAYDHSDQNSHRVWTVMAGPNVDSNLAIGDEANPVGEATDAVPTIAEILGFKDDVINAGILDVDAKSLFDRI
ncbi:MAG: hypothetical protein IH946_03360 [Bacteroidetes bacterium]|nr:hypothetical protein [Bacteroidota bacterium]